MEKFCRTNEIICYYEICKIESRTHKCTEVKEYTGHPEEEYIARFSRTTFLWTTYGYLCVQPRK